MEATRDSKLAPGTDVGGYIVEDVLGQGGMGVVYRATHPVIGKRVAIKVLRAEIAEHQDAVERFTQEARAVNQIGHPNIVDIFGFGTTPDGCAYLMMDLLAGESLRKRLRRGPLHVSEAASVIDETASALLAVHEAGFIHRDLKPDNVFLVAHAGRWPEVKLLDFGLAKLLPAAGKSPFRTKTGVVLGTPDYMAPELVRKRSEIDHRVDLYALGVMAFEMLAGRRPVLGQDGTFDKLQKLVEMPAPPLLDLAPHTPEDLAQLVDALLAKDREARPSLVAVRAVIKRLRSTQLPSMSFVQMEAFEAATITDGPTVRTPDLPPVADEPSLAGVTVRVGTEPPAPARATSGLAATPASVALTVPLLTPIPPLAPLPPLPPLARAPSSPALNPGASHGGTVLGVAAPKRPSRSATIPTPPRRSPIWVLLAVTALLGVAIAAVVYAINM